MVIISIQFGLIAGDSSIIEDAAKCSCWCMPMYGNVLPYAFARDDVSV